VKTYNGWANWETWVTNLHFESAFDDEAGYIKGGLTGERAREVVENYTYETDIKIPDGSWLQDIIQSVLGEVDWDEIASHYKTDEESDTDGEA
jgi:hypothetical protein